MTETVIIGIGRHAKRSAYHTTACNVVMGLDNKGYVPREEAERRGMTHCQYCSGEFDSTHGNQNTLYHKLQQADPDEVFGDD